MKNKRTNTKNNIKNSRMKRRSKVTGMSNKIFSNE